MPRIRTVKPETASDRKLASVSRDARYTFLLLISQADDDGLLRAEPRQLLGGLYPFDHDVTGPTLEVWLEELRVRAMIRWRRTMDGVRVIEIINWSRHQVIKNRSKPFLLKQLADFEETDTGASVEPTEERGTDSVGAGGAESRVLSPESRALGREDATSENGSHPVPKPLTRRRPSRDPPGLPNWVTEAVAIREQHIGVIAHGKLGKILKPLVDKRGWPEVKPVWEYFCEFSPVQDYLARQEANLTREGEQPVKKLDYRTTPQFFVENYTQLAKASA